MGESSFWYRPTRVVPDQRPLNGRCCYIIKLVSSGISWTIHTQTVYTLLQTDYQSHQNLIAHFYNTGRMLFLTSNQQCQSTEGITVKQTERSRTARMDNFKTWTGLPVEQSIGMTEDRDKWRKYVRGVANPRLENG